MPKHFLKLILFQLFCYTTIYGQSQKSLIKTYIGKELPNTQYGEILISKEGPILVSSSEFSFMMITGGNVGVFTFGLENQDYGIKNIKSVFTGAPLKTLTESADGNIFFVTAENQITYFKNTESGICDLPPFYFPVKGDSPKEIKGLWFDRENNLYIGATGGAFYIVPKAGANESLNPKKYKIGRTQDSSMIILKGELTVKKIMVGPGLEVYSFAGNRTNTNIIWLGTSKGLYTYNKNTGEISNVIPSDGSLTVTHIEPFNNGDIWFSTLEKGMGVYHQLARAYEFFTYSKKQAGANTLYPIQDFCIKSADDFFVAVKDSSPSIFNISDRSYKFLNDPSFALSKNSTTDIKLDSSGNFYFIKGGFLFSANVSDNAEWLGPNEGNITYTPLIYGVTDFNRREITNFLTKPELLKKLTLSHNQNSIIIYLTSNYFSGKKNTQYAWKLDGDVNNWVELPGYDNKNDSSNNVELPDMKPGKYLFHVKIKVGNGEWSQNEAQMEIIITPPYWATWWFWSAIIGSISVLVYVIVKLRVDAVKRRERLRAKYEKELLELEAKALRAQMNPHFIFNCMNSIKSLVQKKDEDKAVNYLTTFSKLIRTIFQNSDKKEISLFDEIETCRLYTQLESMRFGNKFTYSFSIDDTIDLKSLFVPALIIQPFIENAIWHGIMPKEDGGYVNLTVKKDGENVLCIIDDNGIGREMSKQNKFKGDTSTHQSKGVHLTQSRLDIDNLLSERNATIETIDKKEEDDKATGTTIIFTFKEY